jgi:hypothetical protein
MIGVDAWSGCSARCGGDARVGENADAGALGELTVGRPARHGVAFHCSDPTSWHRGFSVGTTTPTERYGTARASAWDRMHPRLTRRAAWIGHDEALPIIEGTLIRLAVEHLPGDRDPQPVWLFSSATDLAADEVDRLWQAFLRRFDPRAHLPSLGVLGLWHDVAR